MYPIENWKAKRGYKFGTPTFYGTKHTGLDILVQYVPLFAAFNGVATGGFGPEGGFYSTLTVDHPERFGYKSLKITNRHLKALPLSGRVREAQQLATTGNSGKYTTAPHLHLEVEIDGKLVDPETFNFNPMQLVQDKGTVYIITGNKDKRKIGLADLTSLGLFGDEVQVSMDTSKIPQYNTIKNGNTIE